MSRDYHERYLNTNYSSPSTRRLLDATSLPVSLAHQLPFHPISNSRQIKPVRAQDSLGTRLFGDNSLHLLPYLWAHDSLETTPLHHNTIASQDVCISFLFFGDNKSASPSLSAELTLFGHKTFRGNQFAALLPQIRCLVRRARSSTRLDKSLKSQLHSHFLERLYRVQLVAS